MYFRLLFGIIKFKQYEKNIYFLDFQQSINDNLWTNC